MIVGVYGVGYLIAAGDHRRHWPIVLVGLLGKILGPIGFAWSLADGSFPPSLGLTILTNDLIWWVPFAMILWDAARSRGELPEGAPPTLEEALKSLRDQNDRTLAQLSEDRPLLLVMNRHSGCTFCRQTLQDLAAKQEEIREHGVAIAVTTMSRREGNERLAERYGLQKISWISDPDRLAYRALELGRGGFWQLFSPVVFVRGFIASIEGHGVGRLEGDGFQMPGAFVIHRGKVIKAFRHKTAADRPDLSSMACEIVA
jgi:peroxiredoxin